MHRSDMQADEPDFTRNKVRVFLSSHTCYELIPESGKVVILDVGLPIRQAFHALHEQVRRLLRHVLRCSLLFMWKFIKCNEHHKSDKHVPCTMLQRCTKTRCLCAQCICVMSGLLHRLSQVRHCGMRNLVR